MKTFAQFVDKNNNDITGTEGICPIDGRLNLESACKAAEIQAWKLRHVKPWIAGFKIMRGPIRSARQINSTSFFGQNGPRGGL